MHVHEANPEPLYDAAGVTNLGTLICTAMPYYRATVAWELIRAYLEAQGDPWLDACATNWHEEWFGEVLAEVPAMQAVAEKKGEEKLAAALREEASHILRRRISEANVESYHCHPVSAAGAIW